MEEPMNSSNGGETSTFELFRKKFAVTSHKDKKTLQDWVFRRLGDHHHQTVVYIWGFSVTLKLVRIKQPQRPPLNHLGVTAALVLVILRSAHITQVEIMGAVLVCFGDHETEFSNIRQRRDRSPSEDSLFDRLQKNWSCGRLGDEFEEEDPVNWDSFLLQSNKSTASSGSRMLSAFYSRVLENDDCAFYFDRRGKRIKGSYLDLVELYEDYFLPSGRRRSAELAESLEIYSSSEDCFSTSSTMMSEIDYWVADPLPLGDRPYEAHYLPRCSSMGSPVHTGLKIHRTMTSPYLKEDSYTARFQSKLYSRQFPSTTPAMAS